MCVPYRGAQRLERADGQRAGDVEGPEPLELDADASRVSARGRTRA
jgi:hypothetical protein